MEGQSTKWGSQATLQTLDLTIKERRLRLLAHVLRIDNSRLPKQAIYWESNNTKQRPGGPRKNWLDIIRRAERNQSVLGISTRVFPWQRRLASMCGPMCLRHRMMQGKDFINVYVRLSMNPMGMSKLTWQNCISFLHEKNLRKLLAQNKDVLGSLQETCMKGHHLLGCLTFSGSTPVVCYPAKVSAERWWSEDRLPKLINVVENITSVCMMIVTKTINNILMLRKRNWYYSVWSWDDQLVPIYLTILLSNTSSHMSHDSVYFCILDIT